MSQLRQAQHTIKEMPAPTKWLPLVTSLSPRVLERGDRARVDARSTLPFGLEARCRGGHASRQSSAVAGNDSFRLDERAGFPALVGGEIVDAVIYKARPCPARAAQLAAGVDRLRLLRIADQHHLGPRLGRVAQHALHLPRAHHPGLI